MQYSHTATILVLLIDKRVTCNDRCKATYVCWYAGLRAPFSLFFFFVVLLFAARSPFPLVLTDISKGHCERAYRKEEQRRKTKWYFDYPLPYLVRVQVQGILLVVRLRTLKGAGVHQLHRVLARTLRCDRHVVAATRADHAGSAGRLLVFRHDLHVVITEHILFLVVQASPFVPSGGVALQGDVDRVADLSLHGLVVVVNGESAAHDSEEETRG